MVGAPREDGWEELRREIEALHDDPIRFGSAKDASQNTARAVLAIVSRLAAARGEPEPDKLRKALALAHSMLHSGENPTRQSEDIMHGALLVATPTTPEPDP